MRYISRSIILDIDIHIEINFVLSITLMIELLPRPTSYLANIFSELALMGTFTLKVPTLSYSHALPRGNSNFEFDPI